jgi:hypothetical protein
MKYINWNDINLEHPYQLFNEKNKNKFVKIYIQNKNKTMSILSGYVVDFINNNQKSLINRNNNIIKLLNKKNQCIELKYNGFYVEINNHKIHIYNLKFISL